MTRKVRVTVMLKSGILDPQGEAVRRALGSMGHSGVASVRQGKVLELEVSKSTSDADITAMCEDLLANTVIESYRIEI